MRKLFLTVLVCLVISSALSAASDSAVIHLVGVVNPKVSISVSELSPARSLNSIGERAEMLIVEESNTTLPYSVSISTAGTDEEQAVPYETALDAGFVSVLHNGYLLDIPVGASTVWSSGAYGTASNKLGLAHRSVKTDPEYIIFTVTAL